MNAEEIRQSYFSLLKEVKKWFVAFLWKNDKNNKFNCWFEIETNDTFGLSSLEIPHINSLWEENGNILYQIDHTEEEHCLFELDLHNIILLMQEISIQV